MNPTVSQIPALFNDHTEYSFLAVNQDHPNPLLMTSNGLSCTNTIAILYRLKEMIGENSLLRIGRRTEINLDFQANNDLHLMITKEVVRKIFVAS